MSIVRAVSKLNLYLRVLGELPNGYHEIETLFLPLTTPSDELEITFRDDGKGEFEIRSDVPLPTGRDNLCGKAADAVCSALGVRPSISVNLRKRIPVAAGMGGGSSDAAALLLAVQERYGFLPDRGAAVALSCGADVPFFLDPRPSVGRGLGERLTPLDGIAEPPILILPMPFPISTPWSYRHLVRTEDNRSIDDLIAALRKRDYEQAAHFLRNDLSEAAWRKFPLLTLAKNRLEELGALGVQITGSGPTLFALFAEESSRSGAAEELRRNPLPYSRPIL